MAGPLAGYRIVELAGIGPGPFCAMLLADMGADVVRVDRARTCVGGDPADAARPTCSNRGRRSIGVDLKHPDGVETRAASSSSRPTRSSRASGPGVTERLGLGPDVCLARNPKLVYGRMTGWGQDGPYAHGRRPRHQLHRARRRARARSAGPARPPVPPLNLVGDFGGGGMFLAFGVVCALLEAQTSGKGQVVDAAMVDGAAVLMTMFYGFRAMGIWDDERGTNLLDTGAHFYDVYETRRRQVRLARLDRAAVLRRAPAPHRARRTTGARRSRWTSAQWPALKERLARGLQDEDPRRVVRDHGAHRRVLRAGARRWARRRSTRTTSPAARSSSVDGVVAAGAGAALLPHAGRDPAPAGARRASTPTRCSPTGASTPTRSPSSARPARSIARSTSMATLVCFHAHPDDESIATGGTMAKRAARGPPRRARRRDHGRARRGGRRIPRRGRDARRAPSGRDDCGRPTSSASPASSSSATSTRG